MERVTGIGGVFFRAENPERLTRWYAEHFRSASQQWESYPNGRFADLLDPEGNPVQLWEPAGADAV